MQEIPRYVAKPLLSFLDYMEQSQRLLHLSIEGICRLKAMPNLVQVLHETDHDECTPEEAERKEKKFIQDLERANAQASFAHKEDDDDFPLLHAQALVGAWGALEAAIEDAIVGILLNESDLLRSEAFSKVRVPLVEFELLSKEERIRFLLGELSRGSSLGRRQGIGGFEETLNLVGLAGVVSPEVKNSLWEISQVRNVIVHRVSVADRRLVQACPWLGLIPGEKVKINHDRLHNYFGALHEYLMTIIRRLGGKYNVDIRVPIALSRKCEGVETEAADGQRPTAR